MLNLITSTKSLLLYKGTYSLVLGIRSWASLGNGIIQPTTIGKTWTQKLYLPFNICFMFTTKFSPFCSIHSVHVFNACSLLSSIGFADLIMSASTPYTFNTRVSCCQGLELDHGWYLSPPLGPRCLFHTGPESTGPMCYRCAYTRTRLSPGVIS